MVKNLPANAEDMDSIPGPRRCLMLWDDSHVLQLLKPMYLEPVLHERSPPHCNQRMPVDSSEDPAQPKMNTYIN